MIQLAPLTQSVRLLASEVAAFIQQERKQFSTRFVEEKGLHNYVSYVDKQAEQILVNGLSNLLPEASFVVEEETRAPEATDWKWIVDPLDGTTNFIHGLPPFAVSIALVYKEEPVLGVIHEVSLNESFYAWQGGGAFLNGDPIRVSEARKVKDSLIATGFPYYDYERMKPFLQSLEYFMQHSHGMRRLGSAATDLAYVACGRFEGFYEYGLSPWDVAAGAILVTEAGGRVSDYQGGNNFIYGKEILASNTPIYVEFLGIIQSIF